ncbi:MAG: hypothetical protein QM650_18165 [Microlunatus sp.]
MDLSPYLETVQRGVTTAAALGDDNTRLVAEHLGGAVEASTRLALISALSDAAAQVSAEIAPSSVELRISGVDPELVVSVAAPTAEPTLLLPTDSEPTRTLSDLDDSPTADDDEPVARISLRLPASVKSRVDEQADTEGISTNAWLLRAVMDALSQRQPPTPSTPPAPPIPPGEGGPFGPYGVFGPHGPFGPSGLFGRRNAGTKHAPEAPTPPSQRGTVQGWVR